MIGFVQVILVSFLIGIPIVGSLYLIKFFLGILASDNESNDWWI